jgi:L-idonate 5-dehydrogenase
MDAIVLSKPGQLAVESRPEPQPGPGEVRVRISHGGICGSDLHYFHDGGFGTVRMREPMILGHEVAGVVDGLGAGASGLALGDRVAVNPSAPCGTCRFCTAGQPRHCTDMRFMGSAMRSPPVEGGFRQFVVCEAARAVPVGQAELAEAAFAEPLAVCLHAVKQAGSLQGHRVLVAGMGPIGSLTLLAARHAGAAEIVAVDVAAHALETAARIGADRIVNVAEAGAMAAYEADKGYFDTVFECSGNPRSVATALAVTRPGGTLVQVGMFAGEVTMALNLAIVKEIAIRGTFRFDSEFAEAANLIARRAIDVRPLLTTTIPYQDAAAAFALAGDKSRAMKVQLSF